MVKCLGRKETSLGLFNYALDEELININPTSGITKRLYLKYGGQKRTIAKEEVFTKEKLSLFLDTCEPK